MSWNDTEYFRHRAVTERAMAMAARHPKAAAIHDELAELYDVLAREGKRPALHAVASGFSRAA